MASASKSASVEDLKFFSGFAWPIPAAFAGAVAAFRFEPGDVLYEQPVSYEKRRKRIKRGTRAIQVLARPSGQGAPDSETEGDPRRANWESPVRIALHDLAEGTQEVREISQGDLFVALWRGDETRLEGGSEPAAMPRTARDLGQWLPAALGVVRARTGEAKKAVRKGSRFLFVVDASSDSSRAKADMIEEGLEAGGVVERIDLTPAEALAEEADQFHPALAIRCLTMPTQDVEAVTAVLRQRLYGGGANAEADSADRFSVGRHGLLETLSGTETSEPA